MNGENKLNFFFVQGSSAKRRKFKKKEKNRYFPKKYLKVSPIAHWEEKSDILEKFNLFPLH